VLSFDPTKNLPNYGSGGMVLTDNLRIADAILNLRDNGKDDGHASIGTNSKMSESDCAQMLVKLRHFESWQRRRTQIAQYYCDKLRPYTRVTETNADIVHAWHKFPIWLDDNFVAGGGKPVVMARHRIRGALDTLGIDTRIHYATPLPDLTCNPHSTFLSPSGDYPVSETHSRTELSLPIYPELTDSEVEYITDNVIACIIAENDRSTKPSHS
jgi:dTDP-4-amino-4,6-dideoxygalactose transaminase